MSHNFNYIQCDIPEGMNVAEYRKAHRREPHGYKKLKLSIRRFIRRGSNG